MIGLGKETSFKKLLEKWQSYQSFIIKVAISAAKYKLSDEKKDVSRFLQDGLMEEEVQGLQDLETKISRINGEYSGKDGPLSAINVKDLKKVKILQLLEERKIKIDTTINASKFGTLFKILSLSSEYVSPLRKRFINKQVALEVDSKYDDSYESNYEEKSGFESRMRKRALKLEVNSIRRREVLKYIEDRASYRLPSKQ
jgi:hypothetical protein